LSASPPRRIRQFGTQPTRFYVVLAGEATLEAGGASRRLRPGDAAFVAVGKEHHFVDYELISVLVLFARGS
jgi:quercetin dioxygenase-like cupin family protein